MLYQLSHVRMSKNQFKRKTNRRKKKFNIVNLISQGLIKLNQTEMVGVTRFELVTSSVSGKRSPPELNAHLSDLLQRFRRVGKEI